MAIELQRTALHAEHLAAGARLIDFGGWEMPLHYGSQIDEHHHVRRTAGMFDVSHMLAIDIEGARARDFLRGLLANDVARLAQPGAALYSCMLNESGGVIDDLIVYLRAPERYRVVVNAGTADRDLAWMRERVRPFDADAVLTPRRDLAILALQGPEARARFWSAVPSLRAAAEPLAPFRCAESGTAFIARTGYTGEDGYEVMVPAGEVVALWRALRGAGFAPCGLGARDTLRLEAGMALYGQDMDESVTPMEAGLAWTVALDDARDFLGRGALEQRSPRFHAHGLVLRDKGVLRAHQQVRTAHGEGEITSGSFAPTLGMSIALARLPRGTASGEGVQVCIRDRWLDARVVRYPFVRRGRSLLDTAQ
ncbi:MAG: glycine cleavage system aminomethyltransferase GcvT [Burkholderiales bacterium]|nr:glycine cleavage system aminomethyltransferase GcvT [Burkholderiales bacterium]